MPSRPGHSPGGGAADQQKQTAAELADRAAKSVDRRYDATKETHHDERARAGSDEEPPEEKDRGDDEGAT
jgi:hypothetical protein